MMATPTKPWFPDEKAKSVLDDDKTINILREIRHAGLEPDQRITAAIDYLTNYEGLSEDGVADDAVLYALVRLNSVAARFLPNLTEQVRNRIRTPAYYDHVKGDVIERAIKSAGSGPTLGVRHFLRAIIDLSMERGDDYRNRPYAADILALASGGEMRAPLLGNARIQELLDHLSRASDVSDDFQYVVVVEGDRIAFRIVSPLDDYTQANDSGLWVPSRVLLTHFKDKFGGFTGDEIDELETLINDPKASESEFQEFFVRHPHFLRMWDHREVYPQVSLHRPDPHGPLIPDFLLVNRELQKATLVDLKLPKAKVIVHKDNRVRFGAAIMEARAQLLEYREWFRRDEHRLAIKSRVGMQIYEPLMMVIIGRSSEFHDELDRQKLLARHPDINVVTFDDIVASAKQRRIVIRGDGL